MINFWKMAYEAVKKQRDDYKAQRDTLIDDIAVLRANNERLERELEIINKHEDGLVSTVKLKDELLKESGEKIAELERENEQKTKVINLYKKAYEKTHKGWFRYKELTDHIRAMKFASPYSYNYIHLVNFIKELERADDGI